MNIIQQAVGEIQEVSHLASADVVAQHIPSSATFVTLATVMMLEDPNAFALHFSHTNLLTGTNTRDGLNGTKYIGYLFHDATTLYFATETQTIYTIQLAEIQRFDGSYPEAFLLLLTNGTGLFVGQITPVQLPASSNYQTTPHVSSDDKGGWYKEFVQLGVISQQEVQANTRSGRTFMIVWIVLFVAFTLFIILKH